MALPSPIPVGRERAGVPQPSGPFASLQREVERLFSEFGRGFPGFGAGQGADLMPRTDVTETDGTIEVTAELPGLEEKDVEVNLADNVLVIRGEKKAEKDEQKKDYRLVERSYGSFARRIELPAGIDPAAITAKLANGVLTVTVPKPPAAVPHRIDVKAAA